MENMKTERENDKRFIKSKNQLVTAFKQMMETMRFEEISVSALCKNAKVDRKTFYLHYATLEDLLSEILNEMNETFIERMKGQDITNIASLISEHINFLCDQGQFLERILTEDSYSYIAGRNIRRFLTSYPKLYKPFEKMDQKEANIVISYINSSYLQMLTQWVQDGKAVPRERFIEVVTSLISNGITLSRSGRI